MLLKFTCDVAEVLMCAPRASPSIIAKYVGNPTEWGGTCNAILYNEIQETAGQPRSCVEVQHTYNEGD